MGEMKTFVLLSFFLIIFLMACGLSVFGNSVSSIDMDHMTYIKKPQNEVLFADVNYRENAERGMGSVPQRIPFNGNKAGEPLLFYRVMMTMTPTLRQMPAGSIATKQLDENYCVFLCSRYTTYSYIYYIRKIII